MSFETEGLKNMSEEESTGAEAAAEVDTATADAAKDELTVLKQQLEDQRNDYLRLAAEFDNYRKRSRRDITEIVKSANESLIAELLDVLDNFERALKSREEGVEPDSYSKGMSLVYERLVSILSNAGLKRFDSVGEPFDPRLHEALMQTETDEQAPDTVVSEFLPGYMLNDKVIRHAKVSVAKAREGK